MRIVFLNPQGNFDQDDSHMTEHPDFGGQLIYVKEVSMALARMGVKVDIATRRIEDPEWPEFRKDVDYYEGYEENLRIVRIPCGGLKFLRKELLWEHLEEFIENLLSFYGDEPPGFATAHYGDGGYSAVLLRKKAGLGFTFTGHSLGAQKMDKLGMDIENFDRMEQQYRFSKRITAERLSMTHSFGIITSTSQERFGQYSHPLYGGAVDVGDDSKFHVIPPGVNTGIFYSTPEGGEDDTVRQSILQRLGGSTKPCLVVSSRLDEKKNHLGVVKAYMHSGELQKKSNLAVLIRGIDDPYSDITSLSAEEQRILRPILEVIEQGKLKDSVFFFNIKSQRELASAYRSFAGLGSVFALTAFYEPFGLAPIEAAACGLAVVATRNGGPSEIFMDGSGVLVDPFDTDSIAEGLLEGLNEYERYSGMGQRRVKEKYTWERTAEAYLSVIRKGAGEPREPGLTVPELDATGLIKGYLAGAVGPSTTDQ
jgi:sucrose-phosphate synthase